MKFGFELETFCLAHGKPVLVPSGLPYDECGWLVEVRSEPHCDIDKAVALLRVETARVQKAAFEKGVKLLFQPLFDIPRPLKVEAARNHGKGLLKFQNIYGHSSHSTRLATASLHVSVTNERTYSYKGSGNLQQTFRYPGFVDHAKLIVGLDAAFKEEIRLAKRRPGFYEVKHDGRIEYRSLPNNVDLDKLTRVLQELFPAQE